MVMQKEQWPAVGNDAYRNSPFPEKESALAIVSQLQQGSPDVCARVAKEAGSFAALALDDKIAITVVLVGNCSSPCFAEAVLVVEFKVLLAGLAGQHGKITGSIVGAWFGLDLR